MLIPSKADPNLKMCIAILFPRIKEKIFKLENSILTEPTSFFFLSWEGIFQNGVLLYRKWKIDQIEGGRLLHRPAPPTFPQYTFVLISNLVSDFYWRDHYKGQSKEWSLFTTFFKSLNSPVLVWESGAVISMMRFSKEVPLQLISSTKVPLLAQSSKRPCLKNKTAKVTSGSFLLIGETP